MCILLYIGFMPPGGFELGSSWEQFNFEGFVLIRIFSTFKKNYCVFYPTMGLCPPVVLNLVVYNFVLTSEA